MVKTSQMGLKSLINAIALQQCAVFVEAWPVCVELQVPELLRDISRFDSLAAASSSWSKLHICGAQFSTTMAFPCRKSHFVYDVGFQ
jgi:hypothetical protein